MSKLSICPDCGAELPFFDGPTHRYIGASAACWNLFTQLNNAGTPPLAPGRYNSLLVDAYAAQHYGVPSPQAIQSVAVHLLALHGVLEGKADPADVLDIRIRALHGNKKDRFTWLTPPDMTQALTIAQIVQAPTAEERTQLVEQYAKSVYALWSENHYHTIVSWYTRFINR